MTAPDARQSDELRGLIAEALADADTWTPDPLLSDNEFWAHYADAILPVVTAWHEKTAEAQARARAAEELETLAFRLVGHDVGDMRVYDEIRALRDALAADDRTDPA